jgi:hypothetical protein
VRVEGEEFRGRIQVGSRPTPRRTEARKHDRDIVGHGHGHAGGGGGGRIVDGVAEVGVVRKVFMNFEFIEGRETGDKVMVKFRRVGIADEEVVYDKEEGGGVSVVTEKHGGGGFRVSSHVG